MKKTLALAAATLLLASPALAAPMHHRAMRAPAAAQDSGDMSADQLNAQVNGEAVQTAKDAMAHGTMTTDHTANMMARDGMTPPPRPMNGQGNGMAMRPRPMDGMAPPRDGMAPPMMHDDGDHMLHAPAGAM